MITTRKIVNALISSVPILSLIVFLAGCYPKGPEFYSDLDLTATDYDPDYQFEDQKYYWMADTVRYITNVEDDAIDPDDEQELLDKIAFKLAERNYKRVGIQYPDSAEFVISVNVISTKNSGIGWVPGPPCYPGWWGCWPGYYPPYWGGYYSYSYTTGSVIMNWYDPQSPTEGDEPPIFWVAAFNGLISSNKQNNIGRIDSAIDQAFKQSPYIQSNR